MVVLIVGGSGFLGREVVRRALAAGHRVAATYRTRRPDVAAPDPISPYGAAKAAAETAVRAVSPDAVIARTSLIIGDGGSTHERVSRHELGVLIARRDGLDPAVLRPGRRADTDLPGPFDVRLDCTVTRRRLRTAPRGVREFLG